MMVVVADAILEASGRAGRLNAAEQAARATSMPRVS
jgi:hypothetical protein